MFTLQMSISTHGKQTGICCPAQAIQAWRDSSGFGRVQLVKQYFACVEGGLLCCVHLVP